MGVWYYAWRTSRGCEPDETSNSCSIGVDKICLTCACEDCSVVIVIMITEAIMSEDIITNEKPSIVCLLVI